MTRQDEPFGVQPEQRGFEILAPLRLAGIEGRIKGLLDERALLLERRDGKGLRISVDSIQRVRHHHVPITPPGITWIGVILLILAARVLSGPIQLYALAAGAITIFTWLLGRRPALTIDTKAGDRHIIHGRDSLLLRTQMMVNRLCDGKTMEEAREGLEELHRHSNYPMTAPHEAVQIAAAAIDDQIVSEAELLPEADVFDEADLELALANIYNGRDGDIPQPTPAEVAPAPAATEAFATNTPVDQAGRSLLDRARTSLHETRSHDPEWASPEPVAEPVHAPLWDRPWDRPAEPTPEPDTSAYQRAWGRDDPNWYAEKEPTPGTRIESAVSEAVEAGSFFSGSMFDEPAPAEEGGIFGSMFDSPTTSAAPAVAPAVAPTVATAPVMPPVQPVQPMPLATTLPEPTLHALRKECTLGVVAQARMQQTVEESAPAPPHPAEQNVLTGFPALTAMIRSSPPPRLRGAAPKEGRFTRIAKRSLRALWRTDAAKPAVAMARPVRIQDDDYADIYGDLDGFEDGHYREVPLRSGQIIRLRADQDHQAEVADRIISLSRSTGGAVAEDEANALIERLAESGDLAPIASLLTAADRKHLSFGNLKSTAPAKETPGHHGISRLG